MVELYAEDPKKSIKEFRDVVIESYTIFWYNLIQKLILLRLATINKVKIG